jgi:GTP:adenosylcobinamide-phosphate guanylyltransferase
MAAGRGDADPVARHCNTSHKCLVEVAGRPMLDRVVDSLKASASVAHTVICIENDAPVQQLSGTLAALNSGECTRLPAAGSPSASALAALDALAEDLPLLIVTGDHPLLSAEMIDHFCSAASKSSDVVIGLAHSQLVLARYPHSIRTLLGFSDGPFCGCNMYAFNTAQARQAAIFWQHAENRRKQPWRLVKMLGAGSLLRYCLGRLSLAQALQRISARLAIDISTVLLPWPEAAIDVDKPADLRLVESILGSADRRA